MAAAQQTDTGHHFCLRNKEISVRFPVPPLDGSKVLFALLPDRAYVKLMYYEKYGMIAMAALLLLGVLDKPLLFLRGGLIDLLQMVTTPVFETLAAHVL